MRGRAALPQPRIYRVPPPPPPRNPGSDNLIVNAKKHQALIFGQTMYVCMYDLNVCILGRTYFVERSIHLVEEH